MRTFTNLGRAAAAALAIGALGVLGAACSKSVPQSLCKAVCDCEHCGTDREDILCAGLEAELRVATDYGCDDKWNAWADCVESQGTCLDAKATYSTKQTGACSGLSDIGLDCTAKSDCTPLGVTGVDCISSRCQVRQCAETGQTCSTNADCVTTKDKCETQAADLTTCEAKASGHPGTISTSTGGQPAPGTPSPAGG